MRPIHIFLSMSLLTNVAVHAAKALDVAMFRLLSGSNTAIEAFAVDGTLTWTNASLSDTTLVQRTGSTLEAWQDYIRIPASVPLQSSQIYDPNAPPGMVLIPAGSFQMGDTFEDDFHNEGPAELPVHTVYVGKFYIEQHEVTKGQWDSVYAWATNHAYNFENPGDGVGSNHPVQNINWYDRIKWCNARSEMEGLAPCYYTSSGRTNVYRVGVMNLATDWVDWVASGYRLPTEAEWEKAARGGAFGHRFPWSDADTIQHARANYKSSTDNAYDTSPTRGTNPAATNGSSVPTMPVGSFMPNAYGLYDMAGNVWEWCWDNYLTNYYTLSPGNDPRGPASTVNGRVIRGGDFYHTAEYSRCATRFGGSPQNESPRGGLRCARSN